MQLDSTDLAAVTNRLRRAEGQIAGVILRQCMLEGSKELDIAELKKLFLSLA